MEVRLLRFETYGIKNIENKITLDFANSTLNPKKQQYAKVKAIYGGNGVGKSAIINAVSIYQNLVFNDTYLAQDDVQFALSKLINSVKKELYIKAVFYVKDKSNYKYLSHEIKIAKNNESFDIIYEKYSVLNNKFLNIENSTTILEIYNGKITSLYYDLLLSEAQRCTSNLLTKTCFAATGAIFNLMNIENCSDYKTGNSKYFKQADDFAEFFLLHKFASWKISSKLEDEDDDVLLRKKLKEYHQFKQYRKNIDDYTYLSITTRTDNIKVKEFNKYLGQIKRLEHFIKLFKSDLKEIMIDKKVDKDVYHCSKIFNYGSYNVEIEYESTGIKKLVELFPYIENAMKGNIVFIDELDANLNSVFLDKLIRFIEEEANGQLIFTSHNLDPIDALKKEYHSIDFLGETGKIIPWKKNGNYNPKKLYSEGMILDCPFNFDTFDFYGIFDK